MVSTGSRPDGYVRYYPKDLENVVSRQVKIMRQTELISEV